MFTIDKTLYEKLQGWCTYDKAKILSETVSTYIQSINDTSVNAANATNVAKSKTTIVELGVFGARSLIALAYGQQQKKQQDLQVYGFDSYNIECAIQGTNSVKNDEWWSTNVNYDNIFFGALNALIDYKCHDYTTILKLSSLIGHKIFEDSSIDILHQDGNHSSEITVQEVQLWSPKMKPGSLWILSASDWTTTERSKILLKGSNFVLYKEFADFQIYKKNLYKSVTTENTKIEESFLIKDNWLPLK